MQQKLKEQSEKYEKEIQSLNNKLQSTVQITKLKQKKELNVLRYEYIFSSNHFYKFYSMIRGELQSKHQDEISQKDNNINDMRESSQLQQDQFEATKDSLTAKNKKLTAESNKIKNDAGNIQNEINQWISSQQATQIASLSKQNLFRFL